MRGNWTKEEKLERILTSPCASVIDLRGSKNLDKEVLAAITTHCKNLKVILLHNTPINESSSALMAVRKHANRKVRVNSSGSLAAKRCLCGCGHFAIIIDKSDFKIF